MYRIVGDKFGRQNTRGAPRAHAPLYRPSERIDLQESRSGASSIPYSLSRSAPSASSARVQHKFEKLLRLADEQPVSGQSFHSAHGSPFGLGGSNDRTARELSAEVLTRFRHDQVCLEEWPAWIGIEVWEDQRRIPRID
jgi:hypothetical protein